MLRLLLGLVVGCFFSNTTLHAADKPVQVFILAGQSNMEGKARTPEEFQLGEELQ